MAKDDKWDKMQAAFDYEVEKGNRHWRSIIAGRYVLIVLMVACLAIGFYPQTVKVERVTVGFPNDATKEGAKSLAMLIMGAAIQLFFGAKIKDGAG